MIIGRNLIQYLKPDFMFSISSLVLFENREILLKPINVQVATHFYTIDPEDILIKPEKILVFWMLNVTNTI